MTWLPRSRCSTRRCLWPARRTISASWPIPWRFEGWCWSRPARRPLPRTCTRKLWRQPATPATQRHSYRALLRLGGLLLAVGNLAAANSYLAEAAVTSAAFGFGGYVAEANCKLAQLALHDGDVALASTRIGTSLKAVRLPAAADSTPTIGRCGRPRVVATAGYRATALQLLVAEAGWRTRHLGSRRHALRRWPRRRVQTRTWAHCARRSVSRCSSIRLPRAPRLTIEDAVDMALQVASSLMPTASQPVAVAVAQPETLPTNIGPPPIRP